MQNIITNMCEKFHDHRTRNDRALGDNNNNNNNTLIYIAPACRMTSEALNGKSDNKNPNKKNVHGHWGGDTFLALNKISKGTYATDRRQISVSR